MILASSLDNFIVLNNSHVVNKPYVTFTIGSPTNVTILVKDRYDDDGYRREIVGSPTGVISSTSFRTTGVIALNLIECLKLIPIFYDIKLTSANVIEAYLDTSISYSITISSGSGITIGGNFNGYTAQNLNKMVLMMQGTIDGDNTNITMEKYNDVSTVSFNVTSPFSHMDGKTPVTMGLTAYEVYNNESSLLSLPYSEVTIMPTTLTKFQEVDYSNYEYISDKVHFLTNNEERYYNYGERYALSVICDTPITLKKNYYTNSGVFLTSEVSHEYRERQGNRYDFYDTLNLLGVESNFNHQVGYVLVYGVIGSLEITYPVRFNVRPRCKENHEVFFVNEIGGIDSFNFTHQEVIERKIDDLATYNINPIRPFGDTLEIERVLSKKNEITKVLSTNQVDKHTAEWLNELSKSMYTFLYLGGTHKYKIIIIDKFDITTNNTSEEFELELEYHDSDNNV